MEQSSNNTRDLGLLEYIERDPDVNQATLAANLGVAVGTVNWHLKRLIAKGYVKVKRAQRRKLRYIITPKGVSLRARLTLEYIENSFRLYRETRKEIVRLLDEVRMDGYKKVRIGCQNDGKNDIVDICRLTCMEQGIQVVEDGDAPILEIRGMKVVLHKGEER
jgi:DNA-binding MarR family transcriptional regulator